MEYTIITEVGIGSPLANSWVFETSVFSAKPSGLDSRDFWIGPRSLRISAANVLHRSDNAVYLNSRANLRVGTHLKLGFNINRSHHIISRNSHTPRSARSGRPQCLMAGADTNRAGELWAGWTSSPEEAVAAYSRDQADSLRLGLASLVPHQTKAREWKSMHGHFHSSCP